MADNGEQLDLATEVTAAWLSNPHTRAGAEEVSAMFGSVLTALRGLNSPSGAEQGSATVVDYTPAISVRRSLASPDQIVSMIDGKPYSSLKRHLKANGLTPDEYRERYGLKPDYPMVAPGHSEARRAIARQHNFGRRVTSSGESDEASAEAELAAVEAVEAETPQAAEASAPAKKAPAKRRQLGIAGAKRAAKAGEAKGAAAPDTPSPSGS